MEANEFVQVRRNLPWSDATATYARLKAAGERGFLLDSQSSHPDAQWSFIALTPTVELRIEGDFVNEERPDGSGVQTRRNAMGHLRATLDDWKADVREAAPFTGGWIGFLGYEFARNIEGGIPARRGDPLVPDAMLTLCLDAITFHHASRTATLYCADTSGSKATAEARAERLATLLASEPARPERTAQTSATGDDGRPGSGSQAAPSPISPTTWTTSLDEAQFREQVERLKALVRDGDIYQANLATRFEADCTTDPIELLRSLQRANPSPQMALLEYDDFQIVSASPELLFESRDGTIRARPIAGTRKRGATPQDDEAMAAELRNDAKEQAEHRMLVDLVRNDLARVCVPGTVRVPESGAVERYRHVMHLASRVEGTLRPGAHVADCIAALFPGGTVTGAPKLRACQRIHEAEPVRRGPYTGSAGFISWSHNAGWNILIRTLVLRDGKALVHAGSGIVADSEPQAEWKEANRKARALLEAATGHDSGGGRRDLLGHVTPAPSWNPPTAAASTSGRVLLVDNEDSFIHNLADYCALLGAAVRVIRNDADWRKAIADFRPTHVILGPGPGWPDESGATWEAARELPGRMPLLGVCLGHQALGQGHGARVTHHPKGPVHGKTSTVHRLGREGLLADLPDSFPVARYHSLIVEGLGSDWVIDGTLDDGTIMSFHHVSRPVFGVQFHPESIGTPDGLAILRAFLARTS